MSSVEPVYSRWAGGGNGYTPPTPLTSGDAAHAAVVSDVSSLPMRIDPPDYAVLWWVSRFKQLRTDQIATLVFPHVKSRTSYDRVLKQLIATNQLELIPTGVTNTNVYQLGANGWGQFNTGRRKTWTTPNYHALTIADVFIAIQQTNVEVVEWQTEPDCHRVINNIKLEPDLYVVIKDDPNQPPLHLWLEIDLGGERQRQLTDKIERYIWAHNDPETPAIPRIVFLCTNELRVREIRSIIARMDVPDGLISVELVSNVHNLW